ncbi:MAG: 5-methylcytosine restriction system specificity protein McrC [Anaerovoracaceae bacterium]|jgi:5-methylcytosine-specific restriction enzyme subunit McrC
MSDRKTPIPIKNLFYMLCYAWNVLAVVDDVKVGTDDYDDAYNLLARVYAYGIGKLIRSGFHRSYIEKTEELSTLRGKIEVQESMSKLTMQRKHLICTYDEYSTDDIFNQILKYTIDSLIKNPNVDKLTKRELKKESAFFGGIGSLPPTKENRQKLIFNRNNITYKLLINIATMLYDNTVVSEEYGKDTFKDFYRQEQMHKVFEMFVLNFYKTHLDRKKYRVHAPKINWHLDENADKIWGDFFDVEDSPGDRRTDIVIENKELNLQLIFDAKYYEKTFVNAYMNSDDERARTGHLNQVRGYLIDSEFKGDKMGALIYPMVNNDIANGKMFAIQDSNIIVKTINLDTEWRDIEEDLLTFLEKFEKGYIKGKGKANG